MLHGNDCNNDDDNMGRAGFFFVSLSLPCLESLFSNLDIKADMELRGSGFFTCAVRIMALSAFCPVTATLRSPMGGC